MSVKVVFIHMKVTNISVFISIVSYANSFEIYI